MIFTLFARNASRSQEETQKKVETTKDSTEPPKRTAKALELKFPERLINEIHELQNRNQGLIDVLEFIRLYAQDKFNKAIMVTMVYRTDAEQDELYKNDAKYKLKKFKSPHQFYHAFDLRSRTFTRAEIDELVNAINEKFNATNFYRFTAVCHDIDGDGPQAEHFHVQFTKKA